MKDLVEVLAKALVDKPEKVRVNEIVEENQIIYELTVAPEDMWKIIGKKGRIAKAIRTFVSAASIKEKRRITIEII